jgi:hypothetical protein
MLRAFTDGVEHARDEDIRHACCNRSLMELTKMSRGGFKFAVRIVDYPSGKPGDVGLFFS